MQLQAYFSGPARPAGQCQSPSAANPRPNSGGQRIAPAALPAAACVCFGWEAKKRNPQKKNPRPPFRQPRVLRERGPASEAGIVGGTGFEPVTSFPAETDGGGIARAKSDVVPADLARLIEAWGSLTADDRRRIRAIVDGRQA